MRTLPVVLSLTLHLFIAGALCGWSQLAPEVAGSEGLRGQPGSRLFIEMSPGPESKPSQRRPKAEDDRETQSEMIAALADEGLETVASEDSISPVNLATELPANTKFESEEGEQVGTGGQGGSSDEAASRIGQGSRSNEMDSTWRTSTVASSRRSGRPNFFHGPGTLRCGSALSPMAASMPSRSAVPRAIRAWIAWRLTPYRERNPFSPAIRL